jgi:uncharacterized protein (DUF1778 family)
MRGRPKLADGERKADTFRIRMKEDERALLNQAAEKAGKETSTWARDELLTRAKKMLGKNA